MAREWEEAGRWTEVVTHLGPLLEGKEKGDPVLLEKRAWAHMQLGHWEEAAADCTRLTERQPGSWRA